MEELKKEDKIKLKIEIVNYEETKKQLEEIKKLLDEIKDFNIEVKVN